MKRSILYLLPLLFSPALSAMELNLTPGHLVDMMNKVERSSDPQLTLRGSVTAADLTLLRGLPATVKSLDMSELVIKGCSLNDADWFGTKDFKDGEIPAYMLLATNVTDVKLPSDTKIIGKGAFSSTPLSEITAGRLEKIGEGAFYNCAQLKKADFSGSSFSEIPSRVFSGCRQLSEVMLPANVTYVGDHAFENSGVEKVVLPLVHEIGAYAFAGASSLSEISDSNNCMMGEGAFYGTSSLESVIGNAVNAPALFSASGKGEETLIVTSPEIGEGAFSHSPAPLMALGKDVVKIGPYAFHQMHNLKEVVVAGCDNVPEADENSFAGTDVGNIRLYVKKGEVERWKSAPVWCDFVITDEESGVADVMGEGSDVKISRLGEMISIVSGRSLGEVTLYSADGKLINSIITDEVALELPFPAELEMVIVRTAGENGIKVAKLMK